MKKIAKLLVVTLIPFVLTSCLVDDLADAVDDALSQEGAEACGEVAKEMFEKLDGCAENGYLEEGETAESAGAAWCNSECSELNDRVETDDYINCRSNIMQLQCDAIEGTPEQMMSVSRCGWLTSALSC